VSQLDGRNVLRRTLPRVQPIAHASIGVVRASIIAGHVSRGLPGGRPILFGHRGALGYAPENTIAGFKLALAQGATGLESDAWPAADGVPVLVHDETIRRPGRRDFVTRRTAAELGAWDVPTLAELYDACGTAYELSLDVKHEAVAPASIAVAETAGAVERLWLCHDEVGPLVDMRAVSPAVCLVHSPSLRAIEARFDAHVVELARLDISALNMRWRAWTPERIESVHRRGLLAFAWDANAEPAFERLIGLGVDGIYSDYPDRLVAAVVAHDGAGGVRPRRR
jgi:glycerophosphoryl diester phosphodiesterase